jgi:hypothetical protein
VVTATPLGNCLINNEEWNPLKLGVVVRRECLGLLEQAPSAVLPYWAWEKPSAPLECLLVSFELAKTICAILLNVCLQDMGIPKD